MPSPAEAPAPTDDPPMRSDASDAGSWQSVLTPRADPDDRRRAIDAAELRAMREEEAGTAPRERPRPLERGRSRTEMTVGKLVGEAIAHEYTQLYDEAPDADTSASPALEEASRRVARWTTWIGSWRR